LAATIPLLGAHPVCVSAVTGGWLIDNKCPGFETDLSLLCSVNFNQARGEFKAALHQSPASVYFKEWLAGPSVRAV